MECLVVGKVLKINDVLSKDPSLVNKDPYAAWLIEIEPADPKEVGTLLDAGAYEKLVAAAG